jgi:hypothetical protein
MLSDPRKRLDVTLSQGDFCIRQLPRYGLAQIEAIIPAPATMRQCVAVSRTSTGLPDAPHRDGNTAPPRSPRAHPSPRFVVGRQWSDTAAGRRGRQMTGGETRGLPTAGGRARTSE